MDKYIDGVWVKWLNDNRIHYMSDWSRVWEFVDMGLIRYTFHMRSYGHYDFYIV